MTENLSSRAASVELLILDVDGVLTDGGLYYDQHGSVTKRFHVQDGLGIKLAQAAGLHLAVMSGLTSDAVEARVKELGIIHYHHGRLDKVRLMKELGHNLGLGLDQTAFLGDDWVDAGAMLAAGLPMAVANAQPEILNIASWVSSRPGGHGAVREAIMFLLKARNQLADQWQQWISRHD
ncbi:MAG: KdsC family phosphatase [Desulfonatronovibrionaceae bacterium]